MTLPEAGAARSFLFVPGDRDDRFEKAVGSGADEVVCDLEDAVTSDAKAAARERTIGWLRSGAGACVRINAAGTPWHKDDVRSLAALPSLRCVMVPKADDPVSLSRIGAALGPDVPVIALVETALGLQNAAAVAATPTVARLAFGSLDFCVDAGTRHDQQTLLFARSSLVVSSRAAGLPAPIDGVTVDVHDDEGLLRDAQHALSLGFGGKLCVHPRQVATVNSAFSPTAEEVEWASRIVAGATHGQVTTVDGKMVDKPVLDSARSVLRKHRIFGP